MQGSWSDDSMAREARGLRVFRVLVPVFSVINVLFGIESLSIGPAIGLAQLWPSRMGHGVDT
jgi:hypothetical protein